MQDPYTIAEARQVCKNHGVKLPDLAAAYTRATGRSLYTETVPGNVDPSTLRVDHTTLHAALRACQYVNTKGLTPYQIATLVTAAYAVHGVLHDQDESQAERFATAMGIIGPEPDPDAQIAERFLRLHTQSD